MEPNDARRALLAEAADIVAKDRAATHGEPEDNFGRISALWSAYLRDDITRADVAAMMVLLKVARARYNPGHRDSWVDIAGYAACGWSAAAPVEAPPS